MIIIDRIVYLNLLIKYNFETRLLLIILLFVSNMKLFIALAINVLFVNKSNNNSPKVFDPWLFFDISVNK